MHFRNGFLMIRFIGCLWVVGFGLSIAAVEASGEKTPRAMIRCEAPEEGVPPSPSQPSATISLVRPASAQDPAAPNSSLPSNPLRSNANGTMRTIEQGATPALILIPPAPQQTTSPLQNGESGMTRVQKPFELSDVPAGKDDKAAKPDSTEPSPNAKPSDGNAEPPGNNPAQGKSTILEDTSKSDGKAESSPLEMKSPTDEDSSRRSLKDTSPVDRQKQKKADQSQEAPDLPNAEKESANDRDDAEKTMREVKIPAIAVSNKKSAQKAVPPPIEKPKKPSTDRPMSQQERMLKQRVESCLAYYLFRPESTVKRSPWAVMHAMLPYGVEAELVNGNQKTNAIGWMCYNGKCRTQKLFLPKADGFSMAVGPGVQGHEGQFLAMLAQSYVPSNYPIRVENQSYTIGDLIQYEMDGCRENTELTFKLIGLSHYLSSDHEWTSNDGNSWSISKLVEEELKQPIVGAACGGTHRLMGLTYAVQRRQEEGLPIDGNFKRASIFVNDFVKYTWTLQNQDGSFSTNWFESRGNDPDMDRKVQTTGHILEWLIYTIPESELDHPRVVKGVQFLLSQILDRRDHDWAIGPRGHSLRALALYDQRRFGAQLGEMRNRLSQGNGAVRR